MFHIERNLHKLQPCSLKQLAITYKIDVKTLKKWLKKKESTIGEKVGRLYNINQVKIIYTLFGYPENFFDDEELYKDKK